MQELLPYYERELGFLRNSSRDFAQRYPRIAAGLGLGGESCEDPHVERLIESVALLTARIGKRLDDDYPEFTQALFEILYPHYLRPFPSCSIAQVVADVSKLGGASVLRRGTVLRSHPVQGVACRFRTVYDVVAWPVSLTQASCVMSPMVPSYVRLAPQASGRVSLTVAAAFQEGSLNVDEGKRLRCHLHGDASLVAALRDALLMKTVQAFVESADGRWQTLPMVPVHACGYDEDESLIDFPAASHPAYRLLAEHFAFPEKFNFVDIDASPLARWLTPGRTVTLHLVIQGIAPDSNQGRLLETLKADNVRFGCTPIINLFDKKADPIRLTHQDASYPVVADARRAYAYEIYSIDRVRQVRQSAQGDAVVAFQPFYSLSHSESPESIGGYWVARRNTLIAETNPGYETEITLIDTETNPASAQVETLSLDLTCTNRDLPPSLAIGQIGGDLMLEGGSFAREIRLLRRPTRTRRFPQGNDAHWRLISHLSLNHLSLAQTGLSALKETLKLYDLANSPATLRQIEGIIGLDCQPATRWLRGEPFASFVRGMEIRLTLDLENFVGASLHGFVHMLNRFFALYVHANSFVQLVVLEQHGHGEILRCEPCSGDSILI